MHTFHMAGSLVMRDAAVWLQWQHLSQRGLQHNSLLCVLHYHVDGLCTSRQPNSSSQATARLSL
jgi:hypothetical protein